MPVTITKTEEGLEMKRYCFNWTISGSTIIEASCTAEAQTIFDDMSSAEMEESGSTDFAQQEIMIETAPGIFEDLDDI